MRHGYRKWVVGVTVVMILAPSASGAGFSSSHVGARARAMGGAFRAIADDWSAAFWNPAGLAYLQATELDATLLIVNPRPTYTPAGPSGYMGTGFSMKGGGERYPEDRLLPFPTFSGFVRLPSVEGLTFGAALYWTQDVNTVWDLYKVPADYNPSVDLPEPNYRVDLDVWDFHPSIAKELVKGKLSAGVGLSIQRGDLVFRRVHLFENPWGEPYDTYPYDHLAGTMQFDGNGLGVGANGGLLFKLNDRVTLGLSGQTPVTVKLNGTAELTMIFPTNVGLRDRDTTYVWYFQGGSQTDRKPFKLDLELPGSMGLGAAYRASDRLTVAADVAMTFWSQVEEWRFAFQEGGMALRVKGFQPLGTYQQPMNWNDQLQFSLGAQYQARENLILRGGYSFDQSAVPDETVLPYLTDYGTRHGLSGGASWVFNRIEISGQISGSFSGSRKVTALSDLNEDGQFDNFPGEYKTSQFEILLSTIYRF